MLLEIEPSLTTYHAWHATRADLLRRIGRSAESREAYDAAVAATGNEAEIAYLTRRRDQSPGEESRETSSGAPPRVRDMHASRTAPLPTDDEALGWVEERTADGLARAREVVEGLKEAGSAGSSGSSGLEALDVLRRWDEVTLALSNVGAVSSLLSNVHPQEAVRAACENAEIEVDKLANQAARTGCCYEVFAGVDDAGLTRSRPAPRQDARGLPGVDQDRRHARPAGRDQRAADGAGPGVQPQHGTTSATSRSPPTGWRGCRRTGSTSTPSTPTAWCR